MSNKKSDHRPDIRTINNMLADGKTVKEIADFYGCTTANIYAHLDKEGKQISVPREIDFIATKGGRKVYIQSAYAMLTEEKQESELKPFSLTGDSFPKIVVRHDIGKRFYDDNGILNIGVIDFLMDSEVV